MACVLGIEQPCSECRMCGKAKSGKKMNNADRIRNMTNEELAGFLCKVKADYQWEDNEFPSEDACGDWKKWLESEG